jgi:dTDP-4-dehydrorhamnose 3,5-epimerase
MIDGVKTKQLRIIPDERGMLVEILRSDEQLYKKFGQIYITTVYPEVVKAWHKHLKQTDNFACIKGMVKLVLFDERPGSSTYGKIEEFFLGERNPLLVQIPPDVWHGFKCISQEEAIVINVPDQVYNYQNPDELRRPWNDPSIPYSWEKKFY